MINILMKLRDENRALVERLKQLEEVAQVEAWCEGCDAPIISGEDHHSWHDGVYTCKQCGGPEDVVEPSEGSFTINPHGGVRGDS